MRKFVMWRVAGLLTLFLTMAAFVLGGSSVSYAASTRQAAASLSGIMVSQSPLIEDTTGSFVGTVSGHGLFANSAYVLTDNNFECADSINATGSLTVTTDLEGRFSVPFLGGPSFFLSTPCGKGKFTITATLSALPNIFKTTTFRVQPPINSGPTSSLKFNPNPAVASTNGGVASTLYGTDWKPGMAFSVSLLTSSCSAVSDATKSPNSVVDGEGNFAVSVTGVGCHAGIAKFLVMVGTTAHLVTLHIAAPSL